MQINRCMRCMSEITGYPCSFCGCRLDRVRVGELALLPGTILAGRYLIGLLLGQGGFGMTYVGCDLATERKVAIKEYYPAGQVVRSTQDRMSLRWYDNESSIKARTTGMAAVLREAQKMHLVASIPEVVSVLNVFRANETVYIVMDYIEGDTLKMKLKLFGLLPWEDAKSIFLPAIDAMTRVHALGLIHRDLSPDNLMITPEGQVRILDLGAAKDLNRNTGASSMVVAKKGYSPVEQYLQRGRSGSWTDVYAMAATLYHCLTGNVPQSSLERMNAGDRLSFPLPEVPENVSAAIKHAMAIRMEDRTRDMPTFRQELETPLPRERKIQNIFRRRS